MNEQNQQAIRTAIARHQEIIDALVARKGQAYTNKLTTFLACAKMLNSLYHPSAEDHRGFCYMLMECMGVLSADEIHAFLTDVDTIRKAQEIQL